MYLKRLGKAYENRILIENDGDSNALFQGITSLGIEIKMYVDKSDGTIQTAYPLHNK